MPEHHLCLILACVIAVTVAGCGGGKSAPGNEDKHEGADNDSRKPGVTIQREGEPPVTYVDDDDPQMLGAIKKARSTVDQFIQALNHPKPSQSEFTVKLLIKDGKHGEHMWIAPVHYKGGKFTGEIGNDPDKVKTVKYGDTVTVAKDQISDWMYVENGKLVGGFTFRVLRDSLSKEKRRELDRSLPFRIE
jgi:uncharacterized protein YegJ (DUF2314 family)